MRAGFSLVEWLTKEVVADVRGVAQVPVHLDAVQRFTASLRWMLRWCDLNERLVSQHYAANARVYAGFQRFSHLRPVLLRYRELSRKCAGLTIFGSADVMPMLDAVRIDLSDDHPLTREWFFAVDSPRYSALIAARELDGSKQNCALRARRFTGIAFHHRQLVQRACDRLDSAAVEIAAEG